MYLEYMKFGLYLVVTNIRINRKSPLKKEFSPLSKGVVLRKNQIVHISDEGLYTMTDGAVFQGRKRNLSQHKQIRKSLGLNVQKTIRRFQKTAHFNYLIAVAFSMICHLLFVLLNLYLMLRDME